MKIPTLAVCLLTICSTELRGQYDPNYPEPIAKLRGSLLLHGGGTVTPAVREKFVALAGGKQAKIIVIPTADFDDAVADAQIETWNKFQPTTVSVLHAATREEALKPEFAAPLQQATGVWITGGKQSKLGEIYSDTPVEKSLRELVARGGVVGGSSAGAAIATRVMIVRGEERRGLDLLPGSIVDQHFLKRNREDRLRKILDSHRDLIGFGIDEDTALVVQGRVLNVVGESSVTVLIAAGANRAERKEILTPGKTADLIALSRAAVARQQPAFPSPAIIEPVVPNGSLVIVGGGGMPKDLMTKFIELAGGADAPLVYVPCTDAELIPQEPSFVEALRKAGAKQVTWLHTKDRQRANRDEAFFAPLKNARGVWFGGGRQWNLVDSYQNTTTHQLLHDVLQRGGVIGGSSAGASIQSDYMPRGNPLGNFDIMSEGYERGLGFLRGVAIDQHFAQRKRFADMSSLVKTYPQLLGIGIDEATALIVQKSEALIVGKGAAHFYDARTAQAKDGQDYLSVKDKQRFDLSTRKLLPEPAAAAPRTPVD